MPRVRARHKEKAKSSIQKCAEKKADANSKAAKRMNPFYKDTENERKRKKRKERAKETLTPEQKAQRDLKNLKKRV